MVSELYLANGMLVDVVQVISNILISSKHIGWVLDKFVSILNLVCAMEFK